MTPPTHDQEQTDLATAERIKADWIARQRVPRSQAESLALSLRWRQSPEAQECWKLCVHVLDAHLGAIPPSTRQ
jgi:hypothetical protein